MHRQAKQLPHCMSDLRLVRNRMPTSPAERFLRCGTSVLEVAEKVALDVVEDWARQLRPFVPPDFLGMAIAELVHGPHAELPKGPLRGGLLRMVPKPHVAMLYGWEYVDDLLEVFELESQFDLTKCAHAGAPNRDTRLSLLCGKPPTIWCPGIPRSDFARTGFVPTQYARTTAYHCSRDHQGRVHLSKPIDTPGPGSYPKVELLTCMQSSHRSKFAPNGGPRPVCTVSALSVSTRDLHCQPDGVSTWLPNH